MKLDLVPPALVWMLAAVSPAVAQPPERTAPRWEIGVPVGFDGGTHLGGRDARLIANGPGATTDSFILFRTASELGPSWHLGVRVSYRAARTLSVEGSLTVARPAIETRVVGDVEAAGMAVVEGRVWRYLTEVGIVAHPPRWRFAMGRAAPFLAAGIGYLRELHEGRTLVETGRSISAGGGLKYVLLARAGRVVEAVGVQTRGRLVWLDGGADLDHDRPPFFSVSIGAFVAF